MGYIKDCLLIRNSVGDAASFGSILGENLKEQLTAKRYSVIELSGDAATPSNVHYFLATNSGRISKMVTFIGAGTKDELICEKNGVILPLMTKSNVGGFTKNLDVLTFASKTASVGGIGETAVRAGCHSWLGYTANVGLDAAFIKETEDALLHYIISILMRKPPKLCAREFATEYGRLAGKSKIMKADKDCLRLINFYD